MTRVVGYLRRTLLPRVNIGNLSSLAHRLTGVALALYLIPHFLSIGSARHGAAAGQNDRVEVCSELFD